MNDQSKQATGQIQQQEMQIQVPPDVARGCYANQLLVAHTQEEFILDFILATPPAGMVSARVIVSPTHAKRIAAALQENIGKYEARFGEIENISPAVPDTLTAH